MPSRSNIDEAEAFELPPIRASKFDEEDEDARNEAAKLLGRDEDGKRHSEEDDDQELLRTRRSVEIDVDEIVGKGSSVEALIARVSRNFSEMRLCTEGCPLHHGILLAGCEKAVSNSPSLMNQLNVVGTIH